MRCFRASDWEQFTDLLPALESGSSTKAVILINDSDSCHLDQKRVQTQWPVPVLVVTSTTGQNIEKLLSTGQIEVKVDLKSEKFLYAQEVTTVTASQTSPKQEQQGMCSEMLIHLYTATSL